MTMIRFRSSRSTRAPAIGPNNGGEGAGEHQSRDREGRSAGAAGQLRDESRYREEADPVAQRGHRHRGEQARERWVRDQIAERRRLRAAERGDFVGDARHAYASSPATTYSGTARRRGRLPVVACSSSRPSSSWRVLRRSPLRGRLPSGFFAAARAFRASAFAARAAASASRSPGFVSSGRGVSAPPCQHRKLFGRRRRSPPQSGTMSSQEVVDGAIAVRIAIASVHQPDRVRVSTSSPCPHCVQVTPVLLGGSFLM